MASRSSLERARENKGLNVRVEIERSRGNPGVSLFQWNRGGKCQDRSGLMIIEEIVRQK